MDYLDVVLNGYFKENNQEHLEKYFFREFKKAEKEQFFDADEFFSGCQKVIQYWEKYLQNKVFKRQEELYKMLDGAKNKTMSYGNLEGKTIEQKRQETIDFCEKELKDVRPDGIGSISFNVHLMSLTSGRVAYNMPYNEVLYIKNAIEKAFQKVKNQNEPLQPNPLKESIKTLKQFLDENKEQALTLNLSDYPGINNILQKHKDKLRDAELESEFTEVKEFAEKGVKELKNRIQLYLRNNVKPIYKNSVDPVLWDVRLLLEYKELLQTQPKQKKDKIYSLTTFWNEKVKDTHYYKSFKSQIDSNGYFQVKTDTGIIKIYTPELAVILTSTDLETIDHDTQKESEINGKEYLKTYIEAYHLGEQYFDAEIKVSPNILYGANAEQYVRDIHLNYFHAEHRAGQEGWVFVKKSFPFILNNKLIYDYGYYSGIVNKVDEQVKKYPQLFEAFDNCEHKLPPQQNAKQKPELSKIWLSEPQVTVSEFLIMGIEKGIWNEQYNIITARGSLYGTGKSLLGSLFIALKGYAISNSIDYKEAGKAFCSFFNIPISENVKEPYKAFSSGTEKQIKQLKRAFNIK